MKSNQIIRVKRELKINVFLLKIFLHTENKSSNWCQKRIRNKYSFVDKFPKWDRPISKLRKQILWIKQSNLVGIPNSIS